MGYTGNKKKEYQRNWLQRRRRTYITKMGPCKTCGTFLRLEVHHEDRHQKQYTASSLWSRRSRVIEAELAKCVVLCRRCHARVTREQFVCKKHGTRAMYRTHGCRCVDCKHWKLQAGRMWKSKARKLIGQTD